jgi:multimeric flavodoxin WrbA
MDDRAEPCVLDDDMTDLYQKMLAAPALLWASPVYYSAPTAQMMAMVDRLFAWGDFQKTRHARALAGRPVALAFCYGDADPLTAGIFHAYHIMKVAVEASGGTVAGCVHGTADAKGDILKQPHLLEEARTLGAKIYRLACEYRPH